MAKLAEEHQSLAAITLGPVVWATHFLLSYVTGAIWCARVGTSPDPVRVAVAAYTVLALVIIGAVGWKAWRAHTYEDEPPPHDADTREDRYRFLGFATLLLSGLSAVAVAYTSLVVVFVRSCE